MIFFTSTFELIIYLLSIIYFWLIKKFSGTPIAQGLILAGFLLSILPLYNVSEHVK